MKICDIAQFYSPLSGGVKRYLSDKARLLAARGDSHHVLIVPSDRDAVMRTPEATRHEVKSPRLIGSKSYRLLIDRSRILELVRQERPDLIEVGDPYRTAWIGVEAARRWGLPIVAFYHSDFPRAIGRTLPGGAGGLLGRIISRPVQRYVSRLYNQMDATVVATAGLQRVLEQSGIRNVAQVPLGTDVTVFRPSSDPAHTRAELGLRPGDRMLLYVGRIAREKNIRHLLAACRSLGGRVPAHRLVLVGDGELRAVVAREARESPDVIWLPYCESPARLAELYSAADLFVHPGRYETFGIVALEAQACGTPVLAVRGGGVQDAIVDDAPWLAEDGSSEALAAVIARFLSSEQPPEARARRRRELERRFAIESTFERLFGIYEHLIAGRRVSDLVREPLSLA